MISGTIIYNKAISDAAFKIEAIRMTDFRLTQEQRRGMLIAQEALEKLKK